MSARMLKFSDELADYLRTTGLREPRVLSELRDETSGLPGALMQISPEQGALMANLVRIPGARVNAIRALNDKIHDDERVDVSMLPVGDGLMLAVKR